MADKVGGARISFCGLEPRRVHAGGGDELTAAYFVQVVQCAVVYRPCARSRKMNARLRKFVLLALVFGACIESGRAERPVLDLFGEGASLTTIQVLVGTADEFTVSLVQNEDTEALVTDSDEDIQYVVAKINGGGQENEEVFLDVTDIALPVFTDVQEDGTIEIRIGTGSVFNASAANFSTVLARLSYRSNLTLSALSEPQRNVTVTAYDEIGPSNTLTALIELSVPNQDAPVFTENGSYSYSLPENSANGTTVGIVSATDPEGRAVVYSGNSAVFAIDTDAGIVTVLDSRQLDYENVRSFEVIIGASDDDPFNPLTSEATLTVALTNINDNAPGFDLDSYTADVPENVENAFVLALTATDADEDNLEYFFADTSTELTFSLDAGTGEVTVKDQLDYESTTMYTFDVIVFDGERSDTATVVVSVTDVADGRPVVLPLQKTILIDLNEGIYPVNV